MNAIPAGRVHQQPVLRRVRKTRLWPTVAALALLLPSSAVAQDQLDTLRVDSLMAVAADRVQSAAIAAAREDADAVLEARTDLVGYGGLFGDVLGELAAADCDRARNWVNSVAEELFWLSHSLSLAWDRSSDGEMEQWPAGPEIILDELESLQEMWADIKEENRESCNGGLEWSKSLLRSEASLRSCGDGACRIASGGVDRVPKVVPVFWTGR